MCHSVRLPRRALTNADIMHYAKRLHIPYFRGVFMRNDLPRMIRYIECAVVNLDTTDGPGTHWVCYKKHANIIQYFDSFGNLRPPLELLNYFNSGGESVNVQYNYNSQQSLNTVVCGHLCLRFLCTPFS